LPIGLIKEYNPHRPNTLAQLDTLPHLCLADNQTPIKYAFTTFYILISVDRKFDRNTGNHRRTIVNVDERGTALEATGRTTKNIQKRRSSSPPSDIHHSKQQAIKQTTSRI
jgi:hypothetical protein